MKHTAKNPYKKRSRFLGSSLLLIALFLFSASFTSCDFILFWDRKAHLTDIVSKMFPPEWTYFSSVTAPLLSTIKMSVTGTFLGSFLALVFAPFLASNLLFPKGILLAGRWIIQVLRSFPALILALLSTFLFGLGTFAGTVAITLYTFSIMTRLTYEDIEKTSFLTYRALQCMGCGKYLSYCRALLPDLLPTYLTNALYLLETNVRHSSILGYVGAGGIGLLINEKVAWREYEKVSVILILLFLTICVIEGITSFLIRLINGTIHIPARAKKLLLLGMVLLFFFCTLTNGGPDFAHTNANAIRHMLYELVHPDFSFFFQMDRNGLFYLLLETVCISFAGTCIGALLAVPLAFFNTRTLFPAPAAFVFRCLIMLIRSVPFMIYGLIFIRVTGPGAFAGVLTLSICSIGLLCKRFTEAIEALDFRGYHALKNMGISTLPAIRHGILPQLSGVFLSSILYRFDVNIREAAILGLVGAGGIGAPLIFSMNQYEFNKTGAIALGLILLVWCIDQISGRFRIRS